MRGLTRAVSAAILMGLTSPLLAQYPYPPMPYGPMPYGPPPGYYAPPLSPYGANPMYVQPVQFVPRPAMQPAAPRVYDFGALTEEAPNSTIIMMPNQPSATTTPIPTTPTAATPVVATKKAGARNTLVGLWKTRHEPKQEGCGPNGCGPEGCGPQGCGPKGCNDGCDLCAPPVVRPLPRPHPRGHGFFEVGSYFLRPSPSNRNAYTVTSGGSTTIRDFPEDVIFAPRFAAGYVFHNGYGIRGEYWFTHGSNDASASTSLTTDVIATPTGAPFRIESPSATLAAGVGTDLFTFNQSIEMQIGALDFIHEWSWFNTTYLCGIGARYGRITQEYSATRINAGGIGVDREDLNFRSRYEGIGPTLSFDAVCPIYHSCLSIYGNARGTALFGMQRFTQEYGLQRDPTFAGVTAANIQNSSYISDNRTVYALEVEAGFQLGKRIGPCYWFSRTGVAVQRWWDVGSPISNRGDLSFLGGTFTVGVTY